MKKKNFLVTGGYGFIGSAITKMLLKNGHKVLIFDDISRIRKKSSNIIGANFIKGDIRNKKLLEKCFKKIDAVIHLAYINGTKFFYEKPDLVLDVATKGITNIFDCCIKNSVKELYLASSSEVYFEPKKIPTSENVEMIIPDVYNPRYSYAGGKILTELMGINYGRKFFKRLIIFRPHNVYGPNMGNEHVVPELIKKFQKLKKNFNTINIQGNGQETRAFIYIDDFIKAFEIIMKRGKHLNIYNLGTNNEVKIKDLVKILGAVFKKNNVKTNANKLAKGGTKRRCPDIKKIQKLGFKPKFKLAEGLKNTAQWYNQN